LRSAVFEKEKEMSNVKNNRYIILKIEGLDYIKVDNWEQLQEISKNERLFKITLGFEGAQIDYFMNGSEDKLTIMSGHRILKSFQELVSNFDDTLKSRGTRMHFLEVKGFRYDEISYPVLTVKLKERKDFFIHDWNELTNFCLQENIKVLKFLEEGKGIEMKPVVKGNDFKLKYQYRDVQHSVHGFEDSISMHNLFSYGRLTSDKLDEEIHLVGEINFLVSTFQKKIFPKFRKEYKPILPLPSSGQ